jgi:hypothetical protein
MERSSGKRWGDPIAKHPKDQCRMVPSLEIRVEWSDHHRKIEWRKEIFDANGSFLESKQRNRWRANEEWEGKDALNLLSLHLQFHAFSIFTIFLNAEGPLFLFYSLKEENGNMLPKQGGTSVRPSILPIPILFFHESMIILPFLAMEETHLALGHWMPNLQVP